MRVIKKTQNKKTLLIAKLHIGSVKNNNNKTKIKGAKKNFF